MYIMFEKLNILFLSVLLAGELKRLIKFDGEHILLNVKLFEREKEVKKLNRLVRNIFETRI